MTVGTRFPNGFLFGASVSAHQVEGGNTNNDWWWWEHIESSPCREPSGDACDFYHRYAQDIALLSQAGLDHYRRMLDTCHENRVMPVMTFQHFTVPRWLHEKGGFAAQDFPSLFARYCDRSARALGDLIGYACTINEPQGLGSSGWVLGINPPGLTDDREGAQRATDNLLEAHRLGAAAIRSQAGIPVGV